MMKNAFLTVLALFYTLNIWGAEPNGYYSTCTGKSGAELLSQLEKVVGEHQNVGYDGLWSLYKTSDVRSNGTIWDMYSTKEWRAGSEQCGSYSSVGDCYNREHSVPKSWFNDASPMISDAFHIYPTDGRVNGQRGNNPYGECAGGTTLAGKGSVKALGKLGASTFSGYSGTVFEPDDEYKGDFARSYFYMAAAYNSKVKSWDSDMFAGNSYPAFTDWTVNLLMKWHRQDPVSQKEIDRNEAVYRAQENRNPFIDHPELAEHIWGDKKTTGWSGSAASAEIVLPVDGSGLNLGATMVGVPRTGKVIVKGVALEGTVAIGVSGTGFSASVSSFSASAANTTTGYTVTITFNPASAGTYSGTLTVSCGKLSNKVNLSGSASDNIPAGPVTGISDDSFEAVWSYVGDDLDGAYSLTLLRGKDAVAGYPIAVDAREERYVVEDLEPSTDYTYIISSASHSSDPVAVRTLDPRPWIDVLFDGTLRFVSEPGIASEAAELLLELNNVFSDYKIEVNQPFQLSQDKSAWSSSIILDPEEDRFYLRMLSPEEGTFDGTLVITYGDYRNDDVEFIGIVSSGFKETFEADPTGFGSYTGGTYQGVAAKWKLTDAGIYSSDTPHDGKYAVRFGNKDTSSIEMLENTPTGVGTVTLWAHKWEGKDAAATFKLEYSKDNGSTWTTAGNATTSETYYTKYSFTINSIEPVRLRIKQESGKRWLIDDIEATSYGAALVPQAVADYHTWDAFCRSGFLVVESTEPADVRIYSLDGMELHAGIVDGEATFAFPAGLYIVASDGFARRVLVK